MWIGLTNMPKTGSPVAPPPSSTPEDLNARATPKVNDMYLLILALHLKDLCLVSTQLWKMKLLQLLQNLLIFSILGTQCLALRFSHVPITVDSDVILVNKPAELTCNYVKFRTETVREINWFITYQGFSAKVKFIYSEKATRFCEIFPFTFLTLL